MRSAGVRQAQEQRLLVDLIVRARTLCNWTQQRLAEEAHVSIGTVRKLCSGDTPEPGFFIVRKVMAALLGAVSEVDGDEGARLRDEFIHLAVGERERRAAARPGLAGRRSLRDPTGPEMALDEDDAWTNHL